MRSCIVGGVPSEAGNRASLLSCLVRTFVDEVSCCINICQVTNIYPNFRWFVEPMASLLAR